MEHIYDMINCYEESAESQPDFLYLSGKLQYAKNIPLH